jgi:formylglycine-generating enzyme required for sulfatase activity
LLSPPCETSGDTITNQSPITLGILTDRIQEVLFDPEMFPFADLLTAVAAHNTSLHWEVFSSPHIQGNWCILYLFVLLFRISTARRHPMGFTLRSNLSGLLFTSFLVSASVGQVPTPTLIPGDFDKNGYVAPPDLLILEPQWYHGARTGNPVPQLTPTPTPLATDNNQDGIVGPEDLIILKANWHKGVKPSSFEIITIDLPNLPTGARPLRLVHIAAGSFQMGSPDTERGRSESEGPVHSVTLTNDFYIGETEVTQAQWQAVMGSNPASDYGVGPDYPVYNVSWNDITQPNGFLEKLEVQSSYNGFRLPTEAEWEYACRAGTTTRFYFGDSLDCTDACTDCAAGAMPGNRSAFMWYCWSDGLSGYPTGAKISGSLLPNDFGLCDMHGSLWEWCQDYWHDNYSGAPTNGGPWLEHVGSRVLRVVRGGDWGSGAWYCRSAMRYTGDPGDHFDYMGLRVVLSVAP